MHIHVLIVRLKWFSSWKRVISGYASGRGIIQIPGEEFRRAASKSFQNLWRYRHVCPYKKLVVIFSLTASSMLQSIEQFWIAAFDEWDSPTRRVHISTRHPYRQNRNVVVAINVLKWPSGSPDLFPIETVELWTTSPHTSPKLKEFIVLVPLGSHDY